jgi:glucokinase-like ROK family protein
VAVALTNLRGRVEEWRSRPHPVRTDPSGTRNLILELCDECLEAGGRRPDELVGIGVAVPSPIDHRTPDRLSETVLPAWKGQSVFQHLRDRFEVPVYIDNDANLGAVAERWWGAGRGIDHFTYIKLGTGIGSGHIIGGSVFRGATNVAGEIGHLSLDPSGELCVCGNRGCLTTFAGREALVRRAEALLADGGSSVLEGRPLTASALEEAAENGDPLAIEVVHEAAHYLGIAVAGLLNLLNPGAVILGGGMARAGEHLLVPLRETVIHRTLVNSVAASEIRLSELGPRSIALGAATAVLAAALDDPALFPGRPAVA